MEKELEREIYETLLNQVPSECVTVPIIMDCILEQVVSNVDQPPPLPENANKQDRADGDDQAKYAEFNKFGKPDWGDRILQVCFLHIMCYICCKLLILLILKYSY